MLHFSQLPEITNGTLLVFHADHEIQQLVLDSRKISVSKSVLFFAIRGDRHDGHDYLHSLYEVGIRQFVVEQIPAKLDDFSEANILLVDSSVNALQRIVINHRSAFTIPVIGITGSNGKTIIKEWLFQLLSKDEVVVKNPGSYNSQIGVPLSVWQIQNHHTLGIFEAGVSRRGEMDNLRKIIQPTIGIFTNIGPAHSEGFENIEDKVNEKLKLFSNVDYLIYCKDHKLLHDHISNLPIKTYSWSTTSSGDILFLKSGKAYQVRFNNVSFELTLPFEDHASVENCMHVVAFMLIRQYSSSEIQLRINSIRTVPMRLELKEGINQCYIIDDTYNNDLSGIKISLQFLVHQQQRKKKTVILSDVLESGLSPDELAREISTLVSEFKISRLIGVGPILNAYQSLFGTESEFYHSTEDFLQRFNTSSLDHEVVLIKGARPFGFERIANKLQRKVHGTVMEIDLGALVHNFNLIKSRLNKSTKVMVMVKAFAYGSGSSEIANLLQYHQADYLGVAYADEGIELRKTNNTLPIMVMNPSEESFWQIVEYNLEPEIYNLRLLKSLSTFLGTAECKIHLKLDTGMHRLGFESGDLDELLEILVRNQNLKVASVFTHLAGADESIHDEFSNSQVEQFLNGATRISNALGYKPLYHVLNSPGILRHSKFQFDMVRLGIGLYGVNPSDVAIDFKPVATLKTIISQIKKIPKGDTVGYGRRGKADADLTIATVAIGYADGYSRSFSRGKGKVLINGKLAPVIGNVCMDMTMIDITGIQAAEGDEVTIFGKGLAIGEVAGWADTIPYEILTNTSERVKRVFTAESL